jgi:hypothetical protein
VAGDTTLVANEIELENLRGRFYRLTWMDAPPPVVIERVDMQRSATCAAVPRQKRIVPDRAAADAPNAWDYDLGASLPVDRIMLKLPALNSVARLAVQWRRDDEPWQGAPGLVARGRAPFVLGYGSACAERNKTELEQLVPGFGSTVPVATATVGEARTLGGPEKLLRTRFDIDWLTAGWWAVLIAGVVLLGWMALRLFRDMRDGEA